MKIRIEHESARKLSLDGILKDSCLVDEVVLDFTLETQQLSNWCWAAIAASISRFYGTSHLSQQQIVSQLLNILPSQLPRISDNHYSSDHLSEHPGNQPLTLDKSLSLVNCYSHWSLGRPSLERLLLEISSGHLPCARIEWFEGGAHYLVIKGVNPNEKLLHVEDSLHGTSVVAYQAFPKKYQDSGAVWTDTFWTAPDLRDLPMTDRHDNT